MTTTATLARKLRTIKDAAEYKAALIEAGAEESSAAMCATEARVEGFTGRMCVNHAAYCLKDGAALARDAGHAERQLKRIGRPLASEGDPTEKRAITLCRSTWERLEGKRQPRESLSACIDRLLSKSVTKSKSPIKIGNKVLIRTVTHYHTGKIIEINKDHLVLNKAAWIADTGRFGNALESGSLNEIEPFKNPVAVFISAIIDITNWTHDLPEKQK